KCPAFAKWLNYKESDTTRTQLSKIEKELATLANTRPSISDIGLQELSVTLERTYSKMALWHVDEALQELNNKYQNVLQSPILDPKDAAIEAGKISLIYPKRSDI